MIEARKIWTRSLLLCHLQDIEKQLRSDAGAGYMPAVLRRRVESLACRTADLRQAVQAWPVTGAEKVRKELADARKRN